METRSLVAETPDEEELEEEEEEEGVLYAFSDLKMIVFPVHTTCNAKI